ncbi:phosphate transport system substrate-binding protein [Microbacterium resistens]|uniref:Phosphate-binding protein n=1 Tax=Microbacterium resistens TaxID=156977 RepID=A0ABU1SFF5_9MICO|nr:phosphate ABC transporter substrate-binding protein PstS [Microbacterium resistens]MDR6867607.1 phosphate transport system substrate-binding protein [Microbacterium resistens]
MKITRIARIGAIGAIAALSLAGCAANEAGAGAETSAPAAGPAVSGSIVGAGASSQQVAIQSWTAEFQKANPDAQIEYDPQGSGAGRESFQQGGVNFAGSDRAFKADEIAAGGFGACAAGSDIVEIPAYVSPIAVVFSLDGVDSLNLDPKTLAGIFAGKITTWNDPAIVATNPDAKLPSTTISPVHRSDKSGTTGNFTDYLAQTAGDVWTAGSVEEWPADLGGEAAEKTSGVVNAVKGGQGLIGYIDSSQAKGFSSVKVKVGDAWVEHSAAGAAATLDASKIEDGRSKGDLAFKIDRTTTAKDAYPVLLVSYLIGCAEYEDSKVADLTKAFFTTVISADGQKAAATNAGSAPISEELRTKAKAAVDLIK